jgi:N-methylhydantoinase A
MRYVGQGRELTVSLPGDLVAARSPELLEKAFYADYERLYSRCLTDVPVEALNWRVVVRAPAPNVSLAHRAVAGTTLADARKTSRRAYFYDVHDFVDTPVYDHDRLVPGATLEGPVIIEQRASTAVAGPGDRVRVDEYLNLIMELGEGKPR